MPKPVKLVMFLALLVGGMDATRDYIIADSVPGSAHRLGEDLSFWSFVTVALCLLAYAAYRRFRARK